MSSVGRTVLGVEAELVTDELAAGLAAGLLERVGCVCAQTIAVCAMKMPDNTRTNRERWVSVIGNSIVTEATRIVISSGDAQSESSEVASLGLEPGIARKRMTRKNRACAQAGPNQKKAESRIAYLPR